MHPHSEKNVSFVYYKPGKGGIPIYPLKNMKAVVYLPI